MPSACFAANGKLSTHWKHAKGMSLRYGVIVFGNLMRFFTKKSFCHQGFFAVKRREVFILGATWKALVRGWRRDCVVGGMETRFQWRKAHNPYAKCEAFHIAPRLFFMFLFFIPFTIRQQSIIYAPRNFPQNPRLFHLTWKRDGKAPYPICGEWGIFFFVLYVSILRVQWKISGDRRIF